MPPGFIVVHGQDGEGALRPEILDRAVFVRVFVGDVADHGALAVVPAAGGDIQPVAHEGIATVRPDHEPGGEGLPRFQRDLHLLARILEIRHAHAGDVRHARQGGDLLVHDPAQVAVFDDPAEILAVHFIAEELQKEGRVLVEDADVADGATKLLHLPPEAGAGQYPGGAIGNRGGAEIAVYGALRIVAVDAGYRERRRGLAEQAGEAQAREATADDDDVIGLRGGFSGCFLAALHAPWL